MLAVSLSVSCRLYESMPEEVRVLVLAPLLIVPLVPKITESVAFSVEVIESVSVVVSVEVAVSSSRMTTFRCR